MEKNFSHFINEIRALNFASGETPEALIKVYKWIWGGRCQLSHWRRSVNVLEAILKRLLLNYDSLFQILLTVPLPSCMVTASNY